MGWCCCTLAIRWGLAAPAEVTLSGSDSEGVVSIDRSMLALALAAGVGPAIAVCVIAAGLVTGAGTVEIPSVGEIAVAAAAGVGKILSMAEERVAADWLAERRVD